MSDSSPTEKTINPWTVWVPIIMIILGVVVLYNYLVLQSLEKNKDRPPYITRLENDLDGLTERSGKQVRLGELKGKVMVFAHVYTSCPVGCSQIVAEMKDIYDEFAPKHSGLQFVSFAIDPGDNAERLKAYADANDIVKDNWWFVNGDQAKIRTYLTHVVKFYAVKEKAKEQGGELSAKDKKELTEEEKEYKSKRKLVQEKLIKFATRIPAFMYLTDFRENTLQDVITKLEPDLFHAVTGLTVADFHLLVRLKVFNTERMNEAVFAFRRYEDASLRYTGIESHEGLTHYGLYDTVVAKE